MSKHNRDRRRRAADKLPPANRVPANVPSGAHPIEEYGVGSWCRLPDGKGKPEAVAFHLHVEGVGDLVLRLWTARAVDELIAALERHRNDVWPEG